MSLLPSKPDAEPAEDAGPRVVGVDEDAADDVLSALSSGTARRILAELHEDPAPPSELSERIETSLQNVQYHLDKLQTCGAVEVVDTAYSAKGREMDVFAPADQPLVVFAGGAEEKSTLRTALSRLLGAIGLLAVASLAVQAVIGDLPFIGGTSGGADGGGGAAGSPSIMDSTTPTPAPEATPAPRIAGEAAGTATDAAAGLPPGVLFFAGGVFAVAVVALIWYIR
ncbi:MAG: ArsR/SmtB family transcription factor [Salinirussus sp.]